MTIAAYLDGEYAGELGPIKPWCELMRWIDRLPQASYPQLVHLREFGWSQDLDRLESELAALKNEPVLPQRASEVDLTAEILLAQIRRRAAGTEVLVVTDGTSRAGNGDPDRPGFSP